jgi:DNA polymerase III subunit gamma/tau
MFYHKYRPQFFKEVIGQEIVVKVLKNFLKKDKPPHAYLFAGERGTGKTSVARIYAKALNCLNRIDGEPCGKCRICNLFEENKFLDLIEIDAASYRKIEDVRNIQEHIGFKPIQGRYKVFIIDESHSLTEEASNALLKTLEEPPLHAIFILATTEPDRILSTIHSRVQRLDFKRIGAPQIVEKLKFISAKEGFDADDESLYLIAEEANGSLRDAETLFERIVLALDKGQKLTEDFVAEFLGYLSLNRVLDFLEIIAKDDLKKSLDFVLRIYSEGYDLELFLKKILKVLRQLLLVKINPDYLKHLNAENPKEIIKRIEKLAEDLEISKIKKLNNLFFEASLNLKKDPPLPLFPIELAIFQYFE